MSDPRAGRDGSDVVSIEALKKALVEELNVNNVTAFSEDKVILLGWVLSLLRGKE